MMMERVYILLPVHNRREITQQFINSLKIQTYQNFHLILIDDGSTDGTETMARSLLAADQLTVIRGEGKWWWAGSLRQGLRWLKCRRPASADIVLILNDDVSFDERFIEQGVHELRKKAKTLLLAKARDGLSGRIIETGVHADLKRMTFQPATAPEKINCLSTRGLFLYYSDMKAIGGFHPFLLPHYWSDYEFTLRAARKGFRLVTSDETVLNIEPVETVLRRIEQMRFLPLKAFLKLYFSKKAVLNPVFRSSFIFLACPLPFTVTNLLTTWMNAVGDVMRHLIWRTRIYFKTVDLKRKIKKAHGEIKIILGSAGLQTDDWISTDFPALDLTDEQTFARLFKPGSVDVFLAEHVWEHLSVTEAVLGIKNCMKYLKPGGYLRLAVPDGNHPDPDYIEKVKPGGRGPGADGHKVLYDHNMLSGMLRQEGFIVTRLEWYDQKGHFNFEDWSPADGMVRRSMRFDPRNQSASLKYTSLIIDGYKPA